MARDGASETLTPTTKQNIDNFVTKYMARDSATETALNPRDLQQKINKVSGLGGRGFGKGGNRETAQISLSDERIRSLSKKLQNGFDNGKTVMETVISFDGNYLKRNGLADKNILLDENGHALKKGAFKGKIDQAKLRLAIMQGLERMANRRINGRKRFDDLNYVGVIQIDTQQVHCHLAMADLGKGSLTNQNGNLEQKGMLTKDDFKSLRRGIDNALDKYQMVKQLGTSIGNQRQDTKLYVKEFTQKLIQTTQFSQLLLMTLPDNKNLWRIGSNSKEMQTANSLMRVYIDAVLNKSDSGYKDAIKKMDNYALSRKKRENLSNKAYQGLIKNGRDRLINDCANGVYQLLKKVPEKDKVNSTKVLNSLYIPRDELAKHKTDKEAQFSYHLNEYSHRIKKHSKQASKMTDLINDYEDKCEKNETDLESQAVIDFYKFEREYQNKLLAKYQYMMPLIAKQKKWEKWQKQAEQLRQQIRKMQKMQNDLKLKKLPGDKAEQYGLREYGVKGGKWINNATIFNKRISQVQLAYDSTIRKFEDSVLKDNSRIDHRNLAVKTGFSDDYSFKHTKYWDLHAIQDDFDDFKLSNKYIKEYLNVSNKRINLYKNMAKYAVLTNQMSILGNVDIDDIQKMAKYADKLAKFGNKQDKKVQNRPKEMTRKKVISLNSPINRQMEETIKSIVASENTFSLE